MEAETSSFETSEMLVTFLASTPLLSDSWRMCSFADANLQHGFWADQNAGISYLAFSSLQGSSFNPSDPGFWNLVPIDSVCNGAFAPLCRRDDGEKPAKVSAGVLNIFTPMLPRIEAQVHAIMQRSRLIVITGHSLGGLIASLSTLWLLSCLQTIHSSSQVLCITFGSPLLGDESLSQAILREMWGVKFCHVLSVHDIMSSLLFAPLDPFFTPLLHKLFQFWTLSVYSWSPENHAATLLDEDKNAIYNFVLASMEDVSKRSEFWPYGSYIFCSKHGGFCIDNADSVLKMMHLMLKTGSASSCVEDNLKYEEHISSTSSTIFKHKSFAGNWTPESSYDAGVALALDSSGISSQESVAGEVKECLMNARIKCRNPVLKCAELAKKLAEYVPYRLQIQWYKELCDDSPERMGYYDCFKRRTSKRDFWVNNNRIKLGKFWDQVISELEKKHLPHDFQLRDKWVNTSQFYKLLVEPLDIAEYYKNRKPEERGQHYMSHGRERRYEIFDRWWRDRRAQDRECRRSKYASATQDSCFWAKLEEASEYLSELGTEIDEKKRAFFWGKIIEFEAYADGLVQRKEVSIDVLAENSSYSVWVRKLKEFKSRKLLNGEMAPESATLP